MVVWGMIMYGSEELESLCSGPVCIPFCFFIRTEEYWGLDVSPSNFYKMEELVTPGKYEFTD